MSDIYILAISEWHEPSMHILESSKVVVGVVEMFVLKGAGWPSAGPGGGSNVPVVMAVGAAGKRAEKSSSKGLK